MALFDELPLSLPWYPKLELQDRYRLNSMDDIQHPQLAPSTGLLPFQCRKVATSERPYNWYIVDLCGNMVLDCEQNIDLLKFGTYGGYDYIFFNDGDNPSTHMGGIGVDLKDGGTHLTSDIYKIPVGDYYFRFDFKGSGGYSVYSEVWRVPVGGLVWGGNTNNSKYIRLTWRKKDDFAPIKYTAEGQLFSNVLFLDTIITACEPEIEQETLPDGYNEKLPIFQKASLKYRISAVVPDFLKTALMLLPVHDNVHLTTEYNRRYGKLKNIEVSATLSNDGGHSTVEIIFEGLALLTDTTLIKAIPEDSYSPITDLLVVSYSICAVAETILVTATANPIPVGWYGQLWAKNGIGGTPTLLISYISAFDVNNGITLHYIGLAGFTRFSIRVINFSGYIGEQSSYDLPGAPAC